MKMPLRGGPPSFSRIDHRAWKMSTKRNRPIATVVKPSASFFQSRVGASSQKLRNLLTRGMTRYVSKLTERKLPINIASAIDNLRQSGLRNVRTMTVG